MLDFYVSGQSLKVYTPVLAADSLNYLTARVSFSADWTGCSKWLHFRQGEGLDATVYDLALDENDEITADAALNLTVGAWEVYVTGTLGAARLTTNTLMLTVQASGLVDAPLHAMPLSVAEQIDAKAAQALLLAQAVKDAADAGEFKGADGTGFRILGFYASLAALSAAVPDPAPGDAYGVGASAPYDVYIWDGVGRDWVDNGDIQGAKGDTGDAGAVFTPSVDAGGNLSWTNNGGLTNPTARNIMGPQGAKGDTGAAGDSAYDKAVAAGYSGTEATFYAALTAMPYHNARHLPGGADPLTVSTAAIAADAVSQSYSGTLAAASWTGSGPYTQSLSLQGLLAADKLLVDADYSAVSTQADAEVLNEAWALVYRAVSAAGSLTFYTWETPSADIPVRILGVRR